MRHSRSGVRSLMGEYRPVSGQEQPAGRPSRTGETSSPIHRARPPGQNAGHDRGVEGGGRRSPDDQCCAFHRNVEISSRYAWMYRLSPLVQMGRDGRDRVPPRPARPLPAPAGHRSHRLRGHPAQPGPPEVLLTEDVNTIRATNNAIFNDIFWVHLAYVTADDGIERLRALLQRSATTHPSCPASRRSTKDAGSWRTGQRPRRLDRPPKISSGRETSSSWSTSNAPWCSRTSIACRALSPGSSRSARRRPSRCVEFGGTSRTSPRSTCRRSPSGSRTACAPWPRITRFDNRWRWVVASVVPRFRRFDADTRLIDASLRRILDEARVYASTPCVLPRSPAAGPRRAAQPRLWHRPRPEG